MSFDIGQEALEVFRQVPIDHAASVDDLSPKNTRNAGLRHFRNLLAHGLVTAESRRPLRIRVADDQFARALYGTLTAKPYVIPILAGSHLPILAALHAKSGTTAIELARDTGLHVNTVRINLANLMARGLLVKQGRGISIAAHAGDFEDLAQFFIQFQLQQKIPRSDVVLRKSGDLTMVVESKRPLLALPTTATRRFQEDGAEVLAANYQYRIHALKDDATVTLAEAFDDATALGTSPRTLTAMHLFLESHT